MDVGIKGKLKFPLKSAATLFALSLVLSACGSSESEDAAQDSA